MAMRYCIKFRWLRRLPTRIYWLSFLWWNWFISCNLLYWDLISELIDYVFSIYLLNFIICIFINKFIYMYITTSNSNKHLIPLFNLNMNPLLSKLIHAFRLSKEHDFHFVLISKHVYVHGQGHIYLIILPRNIRPEQIILLVVFDVLKQFSDSFLI